MHSHRVIAARIMIGLLIVVISSLAVMGYSSAQGPGVASQAGAPAMPDASSHWTWCDDNTVKAAPAVLWTRIESATGMHSDIPGTYWSDVTYRDDIAKIVCYESTFNYHAENAGQYGWFQMSSSLVVSEGVHFDEYWNGSKTEHAGWYQCTAGERYIHARYSNPAAAWAHEETYGWY
jgi:hypothetical protein